MYVHLYLPHIKNTGTTTIPQIQYCFTAIGKSLVSYYQFLLQFSLFFLYSIIQDNYLLVWIPQGSLKIINCNNCTLVDLWSILLSYFVSSTIRENISALLMLLIQVLYYYLIMDLFFKFQEKIPLLLNIHLSSFLASL